MNLRFLGDAFDHWKGSVLQLLGDTLRDVHVVPLLTDADRWTPEHFEVYARLLRIDPNRVVMRDSNFERAQESRDRYLARLADECVDRGRTDRCDLFLDPDTGVGGRDKKHVCRADIDELLRVPGDRVLLIYTQAEDRFRNSEADVLDDFHRCFGEYAFLAYRSAKQGLSMAVVSREDGDRLKDIRTWLSTFLGSVAERHIIGSAGQ